MTFLLDSNDLICGKCASCIEKQIGDVDKEQIIDTANSCVACSTGYTPSGAHKCAICGTAVHALETCSLPFENDEEGYGQRRICRNCQHQENGSLILESRAEENWGGQVTKKKQRIDKAEKRGLYLQGNIPVNCLLDYPVLREIPILKNGETKSLKAVLLERHSMSSKGTNVKVSSDLINTDAFDAIFQLFLCSAIDSAEFLSSFVTPNSKDCMFLQLVNAATSGRITAKMYKLRAQILKTIFNFNDTGEANIHIIDCKENIANLCNSLLQFLKKEYICLCCLQDNICCLIEINQNSLIATNFNEMMEELLLSRCPSCTNEPATRNDNLILVYIKDDPNSPLKLKDIPISIKLPSSKVLKMRGITTWAIPTSSLYEIGHYAAIYYRNNSWYRVEKKR